MKIRKVKWANHPILGNLELDFVNHATNKPFSTIVFAGENGCGKTTILETLNTFLCIGSFKPFDTIEYEVGEGEVYIIQHPRIPKSNDTFFTRKDVKSKKTEDICSDKVNSPNTIQSDEKDPRSYGCVFSRPRADYKTGKIESVKTSELDRNKYDSDKEDDFTSLKQLIVDIQNQDNEQYYDINTQRGSRGEATMTISEFEPNSKIFRFKKAFDTFFDKVKYKKVENIDGGKVILFEKKGTKISIDNLSTGEKQIVFRGAYLLKNINRLNGAVIMVDEPELSMHPKWQKNILRYYKNLFTDNNGMQTAQLFFASHSEGVISEALQDMNDTKVIILKDNVGGIFAGSIDAPAVLPYTLAAEINFQAFGIASTDYHNALYGYIEAEGWKNNYDSQQSKVNYVKLNKDGTTSPLLISQTEKIRHIIHHPENRNNSYSEQELEDSIESMRKYIIDHS